MQIKFAPFEAGMFCVPRRSVFTKLLLIMNFTAIFLLATCLQLSAKGFTQSITLSENDAPIEKVFTSIRKQTGYTFAYTESMLAKAKKVTIHVVNESIDKVLAACFKDQPFTYSIIERTVVVKAKPDEPKKEEPSPPVDISGKIVNENGEPVVASIIVKGSSRGTTSNADGYFELKNIEPNAILVITGAEIEQREWRLRSNETFLTIATVRRFNVLDESVVIAYGSTTRRYATGSVSSVKAGDISRQPVADPLLAIIGRVPGLQITQISGLPGANFSVQLRGQNSIANGNDPLYIIDGVPYPSSPLYSSSGIGGGVSASPFNNLNPDNIESIEVLKDADATAIYGSRGANGVILITTKKGKAGKAALDLRVYTGAGSITRKMDMMNTQQYIAARREAFANDGTAPTTANAPDLLLWDTTRYTDWQDVLIGNTTHTTDANLSYSGGTAQTQFLLGAGYHNEGTVLPGDFGMEKFSGNVNISHHSVDNKFSVSVSATYSYVKNNLTYDDPTSAINLPPDAPAIYTADGKLNWENSTWVNPFAALNKLSTLKGNTLIGNINLAYTLLPGLQLRLNGGFTGILSVDHSIAPRSALNPTSTASGIARFGNTRHSTLIAEPQVSYDWRYKKLQINFLAGATLQSSYKESLAQAGTGYANDSQLGSLKAAPTIILSNETSIKYRYAGVFGRITADLMKRYLLSLTARRDGSSRYGPANRFSNFGSVGLGWIFSEESFLKDRSFLSFGKLRASAGTTGNDQIGDYQYLNLYSPLSYAYLSVVPYAPSQLYNPDFGWELVKKLEAGLDIGLWKDRILLSASYYHNTTTNQLVEYPLPVISGFDGILRNIPATILNEGVELQVNTVNVKSNDWKWTSSLNLTIPRNKLVAFEALNTSSYASYYVIGQPLSISKAYHLTGVDPATGVYTFEDVDHDNRISSPNDMQTVVFTGQRYYGGLENDITYKRITLGMLFQFVRKPAVTRYSTTRPMGRNNQPAFVLERWQKPGDISTIMRFTVSGPSTNNAYDYFAYSDGRYSDGSFIRLRNLYCSIDLLYPAMKRMGINSCKLLITGANLLTLTRYKGMDPETAGFVPPIKMLTAGLQLSF